MKKFFLALFGFYIGIIVFMPKESLFYKVLETADKKGINVISKTYQTPIFLEIKNAKIFYLKMPSAQIQKIKIYPFLVYNRIDAKNITLKIGDYKIKNLNIIYIPFLNAKIKGEASFGTFEGYANFKEIKIYIKNPKRDIKGFLRKDNKGYFYYERF